MKPVTPLILTFSAFTSHFAVASVDYSINLLDPQHHLAQVEAHFPKSESSQLVVNLPVWRTGKYEVLPLADAIRLFSAKDGSGAELPWARTASGEWTVELTEPTAVTVSYQLYANKLGQRVNHIDASHAFLDASGTFVYSPEFRAEPISVSLSVPQAWSSYSGMERGGEAHQFKAANYDILVDSPIETGVNKHRTFEADGKQYELVVWGEGNYDLDQMVEDLGKLSGQADVIWDDYPFERYVYMVHATSGARGATEHLNSTIIQRPRFSYRDRKDYLGFIKTASHEFIHTWNVKAYRPQGLVPYDYQEEGISQLLWIAEGSTSYFQSQLLLRAGVITVEEFFEDLAKRVSQSKQTPGREIQSIASASANKWVSSGGDYAINHSTNIYSEGYLTSLALDFSLLSETDLKQSYRDVHRELYRSHRLPAGYNVAEVKAILAQVSGTSYEAWWQQYVNEPVSLDFKALLAKAGLQVDYAAEAKSTPFAGVTLMPNTLVLATVLRNGPAWYAGMVLGDEVVAINGLKITAAGFESRLKDFNAGDTVSVTLFSNDTLKTVELTLAQHKEGDMQISSVNEPTQEQQAFFEAWLGINWPFDSKGQL
ncbi:PDZ domain-containing protein [Shewanella sp.]|nr:PDZ domain-containing protein [Shewanella sp.]